MDYKFIDNKRELAQSIIEFFNKPEFWKATIGNAPRYFVHFENGDKHVFGLSKFCAFRNITVEQYISSLRYKTNGGITQKHIANLTKEDWVPRSKINKDVRVAFDKWITGFYPNYKLNNASFITIDQSIEVLSPREKFINPETLEERLRYQREIGKVGEQIALDYEINRLKENGVKNAEVYVEHTSTINSAAGFDINCLVKDDLRFIEVKSSLNDNLDFYITENEFKTLEGLGDNAYIYFVHILDLGKKIGNVIRIVKNPIRKLSANGILKPILYKAELLLKNQ